MVVLTSRIFTLLTSLSSVGLCACCVVRWKPESPNKPAETNRQLPRHSPVNIFNFRERVSRQIVTKIFTFKENTEHYRDRNSVCLTKCHTSSSCKSVEEMIFSEIFCWLLSVSCQVSWNKLIWFKRNVSPRHKQDRRKHSICGKRWQSEYRKEIFIFWFSLFSLQTLSCHIYPVYV